MLGILNSSLFHCDQTGWFLAAYFLGGYGEDGRGMNGRSKAITAAFKSWVFGIPVR